MIKYHKLTKKSLKETNANCYWRDLLYAIAIKHFKNVPIKDIEDLLNKVYADKATIYVLYNNAEPCGFGATIFSSFTFNNRNIDYLLLDVGCIDIHLRHNRILYNLLIMEILSYKWSHLTSKNYVLAFCMTPYIFSMVSFLRRLPDNTETSRELFNALVSKNCVEYNLVYEGDEIPVYFNTWVPSNVSPLKQSYNKTIEWFVKKNPRWEQGYGLPIIIPLDFYNQWVLIKAFIFKKVFWFCIRRRYLVHNKNLC